MKSILSCADYVNRLDIARRVTSQRAIRTIEQDHGSQERLCSLIRVISDPLMMTSPWQSELIASTTPLVALDRSPGLSGIRHLVGRPLAFITYALDDSNIIALCGIFPRSSTFANRCGASRRIAGRMSAAERKGENATLPSASAGPLRGSHVRRGVGVASGAYVTCAPCALPPQSRSSSSSSVSCSTR